MKIIYISILYSALICLASYSEARVTYNGLMNFSYNSANSNQGIINQSNINLSFEKETASGSKFGIKSGLYQYLNNTSDGYISSNIRLFGFAQGVIGELNIGSNFGVARIMQANQFNIIEYDSISHLLSLSRCNQDHHIYTPGLLTDQINPINQYIGGNIMANKINYISPVINNFIFGLSYIPNSRDFIKLYRLEPDEEKLSTRNTSQFAITYRNQFENIGIKSSLAIESGKIKNYIFTSWDLGGQISYMGLGLGLSYGKTNTDYQNIGFDLNSDYWISGISYRIAGFAIELSRFHGKSKKSDLKKYSINSSYQILKNLATYIEVGHFEVNSNNNMKKIDNIIIGMKLKF